MNLTFEVSVVGALTTTFFCFYWVITKIFTLKGQVSNLKNEVFILKERQREDHNTIVTSTGEKEKAVWAQMKSIDATLLTIVQQIGRVEGKLEKL